LPPVHASQWRRRVSVAALPPLANEESPPVVFIPTLSEQFEKYRTSFFEEMSMHCARKMIEER